MKLIIQHDLVAHLKAEYREYQYSTIPKINDFVHIKGNMYRVKSVKWEDKCVRVLVFSEKSN